MRYFGWLCIMLYFTAQYFQMKHFRSSITLLCWFFSLLTSTHFLSKKSRCLLFISHFNNKSILHVSIQKGDKHSLCQFQIRVAKASFVTHSDSIVCCIHMSHEALRQLPTAHKVFFSLWKYDNNFQQKKNTSWKNKNKQLFLWHYTNGRVINISVPFLVVLLFYLNNGLLSEFQQKLAANRASGH